MDKTIPYVGPKKQTFFRRTVDTLLHGTELLTPLEREYLETPINHLVYLDLSNPVIANSLSREERLAISVRLVSYLAPSTTIMPDKKKPSPEELLYKRGEVAYHFLNNFGVNMARIHPLTEEAIYNLFATEIVGNEMIGFIPKPDTPNSITPIWKTDTGIGMVPFAELPVPTGTPIRSGSIRLPLPTESESNQVKDQNNGYGGGGGGGVGKRRDTPSNPTDYGGAGGGIG